MSDNTAKTPNTGEANLCVIQSKIGNTDWVLTAMGGTGKAPPFPILRLSHNRVDQRQLWVREDAKRGEGFIVLRNPFLDLCLRAGKSQGGDVTMAKYDPADPEFKWFKEQGENWGCLNKLSDSEQKLNVAGDGPYNENTRIIQYTYDHGSDHELWKLIKYDPEFGPTDVTYEMANRTLTLGEPEAATSTTVHNRTAAGKVTETVSLSVSTLRTVTHSVSDTTQDTLAVAQTFGAKFGFDKVFEVSTSGTITQTHSTGRTTGDQFSDSTTINVAASVNVTVNSGKSYDVWLMARKCVLTIPYTATITRKDAAGRPGESFHINGTYQYENAYRYEIAVTDTADGSPVANAVASPPQIQQT